MPQRKFYLITEEYTFRGLTPLERRAEVLGHLHALAGDGSITEEEATRLYDTAIAIMNCNYGWPESSD